MPRIRVHNTVPVCTRLTPQQVKTLDVVRGGITRSKWIALLVQGRLDAELHDRSYRNPRAGKTSESGYIGAFVHEVPPEKDHFPHTDPSSAQLAQVQGADDSLPDEHYAPQMVTVAPMDRPAAVARRANRSTAKARAAHSHDYAQVVAQQAGRTLSRCACGALSGWVSDS